MHRYGVGDVEKLLHLPRSTIRALIAAGFVSPERGPRNTWRFSFQDLIVLRTAQALADAKVPQRRITKSVKELRRHLPDAMPLSGLSICAVADRVVVKEGGSRWQAESGQYLLAFEGDPADGSLSVIERKEVSAAPVLAEDFSERINRGLLLHEAGRFVEAEHAYRDAIRAGGVDPVLFYNLGVLLEDMDRKPEAMEAYRAALKGNPDLADCHYNLALLCESLGKPREAIRHMSQYRRLLGDKAK
jgi:tetratricopeptide (TPR) repeat protein